MYLAGCAEDQEQIKAKLDTVQEPLKENHSAILLGRWEMKMYHCCKASAKSELGKQLRYSKAAILTCPQCQIPGRIQFACTGVE